MVMNISELYKSIIILTTLENNIASTNLAVGKADENHVMEFNSVLGKLKNSGLDGLEWDKFTVADVQNQAGQESAVISDRGIYSRGKYISQYCLFIKIGSVLNYLNLYLNHVVGKVRC